MTVALFRLLFLWHFVQSSLERGEVGAMTSDKMRPVLLFTYLDSKGHIEKSPWQPSAVHRVDWSKRHFKCSLHKNMLQGCCFISHRTWKKKEKRYNNLMQGTCSCNNFPVKFNELSCPHICVKWILRLSKSVSLLFWAPAAYQDLSMCHGWPVKKICIYRTTPVTWTLKGNKKQFKLEGMWVLGVNFSELLTEGMEI